MVNSRQRPADVGVLLGGGNLALDFTTCDLAVVARNGARLPADLYNLRARAKEAKYSREQMEAAGWDYAVVPVGAPYGDTNAEGHEVLRRLALEASLNTDTAMEEVLAHLYARMSVANIQAMRRRYARFSSELGPRPRQAQDWRAGRPVDAAAAGRLA